MRMKYEAIQYNDHNEALAAFRKMKERKRQRIEKIETEHGDMTIEELYSLIEKEVKAIYEKDDAV